MYDCDPGELKVVLVIRHVTIMEAKIETACSVEEDVLEVNESVECKAEGKSMAVIQ